MLCFSSVWFLALPRSIEHTTGRSTHREFDEGVFREAVHREFGLEKPWEGWLLTHIHPVA